MDTKFNTNDKQFWEDLDRLRFNISFQYLLSLVESRHKETVELMANRRQQEFTDTELLARFRAESELLNILVGEPLRAIQTVRNIEDNLGKLYE